MSPGKIKLRETSSTKKLKQLKRRGLLDAGVVVVQDGILQGYLAQQDLDSQLGKLGAACNATSPIRILGQSEDGDLDLSTLVNRTPLSICAAAPMEYAVEMIGKLGLQYLCVVDGRTGKLVGVSLARDCYSWEKAYTKWRPVR